MSKALQHQGYSLLALLILILMLGFAALEVGSNAAFRQSLLLQQKARETQTLEQIRASLLGFAASQGLHSQSHLGHLPCPAIQAGEYAQTTCLNKPWGYLPVHSKIAINYLNAGIDARFNETALSTNTQWQYAVSSQVIQPNSMGWSRWVNFSKPSIQVRILAENGRIKENIVAVVAKTITPIAEHHYDISSPYVLVHVNELKTHMKRAQQHQLKRMLTAWQQLNPQFNASLGDHENMLVGDTLSKLYRPIDSGCQCRCTKTRCSCDCQNAGKWISRAPCLDNNPNCVSSDTQTDCTSVPSQPCVFNGPVRMKSLWPVSHFEPIAAINKSCRPNYSNQCPLSQNSSACICHFSWPNNTLYSLDQFSFKLPSTP